MFFVGYLPLNVINKFLIHFIEKLFTVFVNNYMENNEIDCVG